MEYRYFDIHSHLTEPRFDETRDQIAQDMADERIGTISIGVDQAESQAAVLFAEKHTHIFASIGQHPADNREEEFDPAWYRDLYKKHQDKIVCIGECGLDYYWISQDLEGGKIDKTTFSADITRQQEMFGQHIDLAVELGLPLMLHVRSYKDGDAHKDALTILDEKQKQHQGAVRANFHFFTETPEIAKQIVERNFTVSFPGVITFADLDETIKAVPLTHMFSETDSPYAAPKPHRGESATPLFVPHMVRKIAEVKGIDEVEVAQVLVSNAQTFFGV